MQLSMSQIIECYLHATQNEIDIDKSLSKSITKKCHHFPGQVNGQGKGGVHRVCKLFMQ